MEEIGCFPKEGLTFNVEKRLICRISLGKKQEMPIIIISGYSLILPNTPVKILITDISGISSLDINSKPLFTTV